MKKSFLIKFILWIGKFINVIFWIGMIILVPILIILAFLVFLFLPAKIGVEGTVQIVKYLFKALIIVVIFFGALRVLYKAIL